MAAQLHADGDQVVAGVIEPGRGRGLPHHIGQ
jgi:hypothetical protein